MRVCVFVDGENLRHTICDLFQHFDRQDYLPKSANWTGLFDDLVEQAVAGGVRLRTYWYVVQHFDPFPKPLTKAVISNDELEQWARSNSKLLERNNYTIPEAGPERNATLRHINEDLAGNLNRMRARFDGWTTLQNGIAHKHRSTEFRRSGAISYNLMTKKFGEEKTVDVNLAVDMVTLANIYDTAIIVSGDQDYVPAAQAVKNMGKSVVNVAFQARSGVLLPGGAKRLNQMTDWSIVVDWERFRGMLGLPSEREPKSSVAAAE